MPSADDVEFEGQDQAEVFDEENITEDGRDIATSDMEHNLFDVTREDGDAREALEPDDDYDPDKADEAELEEIVMAEEDLDEPRSFVRDDADLVAGDDLSPADLEAESLDDDTLAALGYDDETAARRSLADINRALDRDLEQTFPASDAVSPNPGTD